MNKYHILCNFYWFYVEPIGKNLRYMSAVITLTAIYGAFPPGMFFGFD